MLFDYKHNVSFVLIVSSLFHNDNIFALFTVGSCFNFQLKFFMYLNDVDFL